MSIISATGGFAPPLFTFKGVKCHTPWLQLPRMKDVIGASILSL